MFRLAFIRSVARRPSISRFSASTVTINLIEPAKFPLNRRLVGNEIPSVRIQNSGYCTQVPKSKKPKRNPPAVDIVDIEVGPEANTPKSKRDERNSPAVDHVGRLDLRIGKIVDIEAAPDADELYLTKVNIGNEVLSIVAALAKFIPSDELLAKNVVVLCNLKHTKIRGHYSKGMILCAKGSERTEILEPPVNATPGDLVYCEDYDLDPVEVPRHKKRLFDPLAADLLTNDQSVACYKGSSLYLVGKGHISAKSLKNAQISPRRMHVEDNKVINKESKKPECDPSAVNIADIKVAPVADTPKSRTPEKTPPAVDIVDIEVPPEENTPKSKQLERNPPAVDHVGRLDLRVGKIVYIEVAPDADELYLTKVNIGDKVLSIVAALARLIPSDELLEKNVIVLCNLKHTKLRGHFSEGKILCAKASERTEILEPPASAVPGELVFYEGYDRVPVEVPRAKRRLFDPLAADLLTNDQSVACYKGSSLNLVEKGPISAKSLKNTPIS